MSEKGQRRAAKQARRARRKAKARGKRDKGVYYEPGKTPLERLRGGIVGPQATEE